MSLPVSVDDVAPMIAFDEVIRLDPAGITVRKIVRGEEDFFRGHYPGCPLYPGVFIIEGVHQASLHFGRTHGKRLTLLEIRSARFLSPVGPDETVEFECHFQIQPESQKLSIQATCRNGSTPVAEVKLTYQCEEM